MALLRISIRAALVVVSLTAVLAVRVVTSASAELKNGDRLLTEGDVDGSIVHYRRAARWYAPGSPYHVTALERLAALGAQAEQQGEVQRALSAYRAIRAGIISARSFYTPEAARLRAADEHIATLMAAMRPPSIDAGKSSEQRRGDYLALLKKRPGPNLFWSWILLFGFAGWVSAAYALTFFAFDEQGRIVWREARRWSTVIVVGLGLFILGLALA